MMVAFTRTPGGLCEKWRFHSIPTVWVEGPTDIYFYEPITNDIACRLEPFHGAENAKALVAALVQHNYPYMVVLDGDYTILERRRPMHRMVVTLARYSYENYLWEPEIINRVCLRHARCGDNKDVLTTTMRKLEVELRRRLIQAVILDVAARQVDPAPKVLPERVEPLLVDQTSTEFDPVRVQALVAQAKSVIAQSSIRLARELVLKFLGSRGIAHLVKGHLLFGLLRRTFARAVLRERGVNAPIADDALIQLLSEKVWKSPPTKDHRALKRAIRQKARELACQYAAKA